MKDATTILGEDAAILNRLIRPNEKLSPVAARALLCLKLAEADRARMHELAIKNQADALSENEKVELQTYTRVGLV